MYDQASIIKGEIIMANPSIDNFEVTDAAPFCFTEPSVLMVASDALVSSIGFKQVRDASTPARALVLLSLGKKTVRMGVMANMLAVWLLSCRLLSPSNVATLVSELVFGSVG